MTNKKKKSKRSTLQKIDTSKEEDKLRDLLIDIIDEEGFISRYILEGHILYDLGCNNIQMDNMIMMLKMNRELYSVQRTDGEYYRFYPKA